MLKESFKEPCTGMLREPSDGTIEHGTPMVATAAIPSRRLSLRSARRGAWLVNLSRHLVSFVATDPALSLLENARYAGQCGDLLIKLSSDTHADRLSRKRIEAHGRACGLDRFMVDRALQDLSGLDLLDYDGAKQTVEVLALSRERVLGAASELFGQTASPVEAVIPDVLEVCLLRPRFEGELVDLFTGLGESDVRELVGALAQFEVLGSEHFGTRRILYNTHQFGGSVDRIAKVLDAFDAPRRVQLDSLIEQVRDTPGMLRESISAPKQIIDTAVGLGLIDETLVASDHGKAQFLTAPSLAAPSVGKETDYLEDDAFSHARLLLSSLRYGQLKSTQGRGRITDPRWIVGGLLNRDEVGPCTAIGQDYGPLEIEGVIRTRRAHDKPGEQYSMALRRREPAEMVLSLLESPGSAVEVDFKRFTDPLHLPTSHVGSQQTRKVAAKAAVRQDPHLFKSFIEAIRS
jgi:hypothetical protein